MEKAYIFNVKYRGCITEAEIFATSYTKAVRKMQWVSHGESTYEFLRVEDKPMFALPYAGGKSAERSHKRKIT